MHPLSTLPSPPHPTLCSGAGKTTLLDVLAGRKSTGRLSGSITLNGHAKEEATFNRAAAYIEQTDIHSPLATVREALEFSAALRLPASVSAAARCAMVSETLALLELEGLAARKVGAPGAPDGLAPGERKRLTIGVELVSNAPLLFLDEPTSGLDARQALQVMRAVAAVAAQGRTVVCTVHQPSAEIFSMFTDLVLLARGGYTAYVGPLAPRAPGEEPPLLRHLRHAPGVPPFAPGSNVSTWMLAALQAVGEESDKAQRAQAQAARGAEAHKEAAAKGAGDSRAEAAGAAPSSASPSSSPGGSPRSAPPPEVLRSLGFFNSRKQAPGAPAPPPAASSVAASEAAFALSGAALQDFFYRSAAWLGGGAEGARGAGATVAAAAAPREGSGPLAFASARARSLLVQMATLLRRQAASHARNVPLNYGRFM